MSPRNTYILLGGLVGAALGATAAWSYLQTQENGLWSHKRVKGKEIAVRAGPMDLLQVGMAVFRIVRQVQAMASPTK